MIIGTRGSRLAVTQTDLVSERVRVAFPDMPLEVRIITTRGDRDRCSPLEEMGGYGVFTKELDQRLVSGEIDLAVNSLKDMPSALTEGTCLAAVLPRGAVEDVLVCRTPFQELPEGAVVGTSSVRRRALLRHLRPDLQVRELRGNLTTRLNKWRRGEYDAIVLAAAGLERLGEEVPRYALDPRTWVPPAGQGTIALVCREGDPLGNRLEALDHYPTRRCADLERAIMLGLGASCQVPLGVWCRTAGEDIEVRCALLASDGGWIRRWEAKVSLTYGPRDRDELVSRVAEKWGCLS